MAAAIADPLMSTRRRTFTAWINQRLRGTKLVVHDLEKDFSNGVILIRLLQTLSSHKNTLGKYVKKPTKPAQKLQNVSLAFDYLQKEGVSLLGIDTNDITQQDLDQVLALVWAIICHYHLKQGDNDVDRPLLEWLKSTTQNLNIKDLASNWNNGVNLSALVDYCQPGLIPNHASLDPEQRLENVRQAMDLAEKHLQIPQLMHPEDLAVDKPDKLSTMTYLSQFCCPNSVGERTLLEFVQKKLPKHNITNFTTDWVDGRVLGALTATVCVYDPQTSESNPTDRCSGAMVAAETHLFARNILKASDFINPELDPRLRMAYLADIQRGSLPPRILDTIIPEMAGEDQEVVVRVEVPQNSKLEASAVGVASGEAKVRVESSGVDQALVKVAVTARDQYSIAITHSGQVIRGCPFIITLDAYSVDLVDTTKPKKIGDRCTMTFDTSELGAGQLEVKVVGEKAGVVSHSLSRPDHTSASVSFIPNILDTYKVSLALEGKEAKSSPYVVPLLSIVDPGQVVCSEISSTGVNSPVTLCVDCSKSGDGDFNAICIAHQSGDVPVHITPSADGKTSTVAFTPSASDLYMMRVLYGGSEVPGSPWIIDFRNLPPLPGQVVVAASPSGVLKVGKPLFVEFDTINAGSGKLTASCKGIACGEVPVSVTPTELGKFNVCFTPVVTDNYFLTVCWVDTPVSGSPFQISFGRDLVNSSKCRILGLTGNPSLIKTKTGYKGLLGQQMTFQVKTEGAGDSQLEVKVHSPSKELVLPSQPGPDDPKTHVINYIPIDEGLHTITMLWGGSPIPATPIKFNTISPLTFPRGGPVEVELELDGKKKNLNGEALLHKEGLPEKIAATVVTATNEKVVLSLDPSQMVHGTYILSVFSKYRELPNSPVVLVYGTEDTEKKQETAPLPNDTSLVSIVEETITEDLEIAVVVNASELEDTDSGVNPALQTNPSSNNSSPHKERPDIDNTPNTQQTSISVGNKPEVTMTTTPTDTALIVDLVQEEEEAARTQTHSTPEPSPGHATPEPSAPDKPTLETVPEQHATPPPIESSPEAQNQSPSPVLESLETKETGLEHDTSLSLASTAAVEDVSTESKSEGAKNRKPKKTKLGQEKSKLKKEKEKEKAVKAEKIRREKEEKKIKKEKSKAGGLNLEEHEFRVGVKMKYKLYCEALGNKAPDVICNPTDGAKHTIIPAPQFGKNTYWCELTPLQVGPLEVSIVYENFHILGSPFSVVVGPRGDASQCTMVETSSTCRQQLQNSLLFCIDVPQSAGKGKLTALVKKMSTQKRLTGVLTTPITENHYHIEFPSTGGLEYILNVKYDDKHINGSPFVINLGDPKKCKVHGDGIKQAQVEEENTFEVDGTEAGPGELSVKIERDGKEIKPKITVTGDNQYCVAYKTQKPGIHHVTVQWGEGHVKNSPFSVPCISASQFTMEESHLHRVYAGVSHKFKIVSKETLHIRKKQLSVFAHPKNDISQIFSGEIEKNEEDAFECSLHPTQSHVGLCSLHICWSGKEINGSPYELNIEPTPSPSEFSLEAMETESGDITVNVTGPVDAFASENVTASAVNVFNEENVPVKVTKISNEKNLIVLVPSVGGEYRLSILYAGVHIARSPFTLTQADPSRCVIQGEGIRVSRVNELTQFTIDHSKAGIGHLKIEIEGEEGNTIEPFIASGETLSEVSYISKHLGVYHITAHWGDHEFPNSPFTMYTVDPIKFSLSNSLPKRLPVNQALNFAVGAEGGVEECERLTVTAKLIHQQTIYRGRVIPVSNGNERNFKCTIDIPEEGQYAIYVQCRGLDIQGSPFKMKMMPAPQPAKVKVSGDGLKGGVVGERQRFTIDAREAGYGNIQLKVEGSSMSIDLHRHESSRHIIIAEYIPQHPGKYMIHVSLAGLVVPGSPYPVTILSSSRGSKREASTRDWNALQSSSSQLIEPVH